MRSRALLGAVLAAFVLAAGCSSGESILQAGNEPPPPVPTAGPPPSTIPGQTLPSTVPPTIATTTTTPLDTLPPCPVDALDGVTSPVEITFWHGLGSVLETTLTDLTEEYNASQDKVRVNLENQGGYNQTIDKYVQSRQRSRPEMVMFPEYMVQQIADSESVIPIGACIEASGFDTTPFLPRTLLAYQTEGVQWSMPFNVSDPVLYYNRKVFEAAGLDAGGLPGVAGGAASDVADDRRHGRGGDGDRPRLGRRLRRRLVPRAVVRPGRRVLCRQRQRPAGAGDPGALRRARSASN